MNAFADNWVIIAIIVNVLAGLLIFFYHNKSQSPDSGIPGKFKTRVYLPLVPTIIISVLVTVTLYFIKHFYR